MSESLRDQLAAQLDQIETVPEPEAPQEPQAATQEAAPAPEETKEEKAGRTAGRLRDDKGRLMPGKALREEAPTQPPTQAAQAPVEAPKQRQRPSSWKKDFWDRWDKVSTEDPSFADYLLQREQEFAKGVSTYKAELDHAKPILEALSPFNPILQQHNIHPAQFVTNLGRAHQTLAMGSPEQKIQMFAKLARDYGVPLSAFTANGEVQVPQEIQALNPVVERIQQLEGRLHGYLSAQEQREQQNIQTEIQRFSEDKPHFEEVKPTMARLLEAGIVADLPSAYEAAVRMPQHAEIFQAMQEQQRLEKEQADKQRAIEAAKSARSKAVSVRGSTPVAPASSGKKGLRDVLSEAVESNFGGRV